MPNVRSWDRLYSPLPGYDSPRVLRTRREFWTNIVLIYSGRVDPTNHVVKLCAQGMEEEGRGNIEEARKLFAQAWTQSTSDFERCIAAHYVARHQPTAELSLHWNQEALDCANRVGDTAVDEFFPSLYLNLGKSLEDLGSTDKAREMYECAEAKIICLPPGPYRDIVQDGIQRGLERVSGARRSR